MQTPFPMFAAYNQWANERIYAASGTLEDVDYFADRGAFFGSLHRTLNHIVVGDLIWMRRFTGTGPSPDRLDAILSDTFDDLIKIRRALDERIIAYIAELNDDDLAGEFTYRTIIKPAEISQPLAPALSHFFNHQTHHRGQAHCLLTQISGDAPSLDLIQFQRET